MAFAALLGIGLSGVGVWLIKTTFDETRKSNDIAMKSHVAQNRAWLIVNRVQADWSMVINKDRIDVSGEVYFVIENTGNSAANEISTRTAVSGPSEIWPKTWKAEPNSLNPECLPPKANRLVEHDFFVSIPLKSDGNFLNPQFACIHISYDGGGTDRFVTECILNISSEEENAGAGWNNINPGMHLGARILMDAHSHFGYFRTVT